MDASEPAVSKNAWSRAVRGGRTEWSEGFRVTEDGTSEINNEPVE